jgi:hypothetical protein
MQEPAAAGQEPAPALCSIIIPSVTSEREREGGGGREREREREKRE